MSANSKLRMWKTQSGYGIVQILFGRSNVFLLTNGKTNILIDTSVPRLWPKLHRKLAGLGVNRIDYLVLTHAHFDHAGNAQIVKATFGAKVIVHKNESAYLVKGDNVLPNGTNLIARSLVGAFGKLLLNRFRYEPCQPDLPVGSSFDLKDIGFNAYLMHTPGHTSGSMSVIVDNEIAIVGDTMFGVFNRSVFPPFANDVPEMLRSWGALLNTGCYLFIPSHGTANSRLLVHNDYRKRVG